MPDAVRFLRIPGVVYRELDGIATQIDLSIAWRSDDQWNALRRFIEVAQELAATPMEADGY